MSEDWLNGDPLADPEDPAAREREERRREREEKRRQKAGKQAEAEKQAPPPPPSPEPPAQPRTPEQEFWDEEPEPSPEAAAAPEQPAATDEGEPAPEPPVIEPEPPAAEPEPEPAAALHDDGDPAMAGAARVGRRSDGGGGGGRRGGVLGALSRHPFRIAGVVVAILALWFLNALFQPFHGDGSGKVQVTIPKGSSVSEVGDLLGDKGVIDSSTLFQVRVTLAGKRSEIFPGHYTMAHDMSYGAAIDELSKPPLKRELTVTIPEGYTRSQIAVLAREDGLSGSYMKESKKSKYLDPAKYGSKEAKNLEGFLFPDTFTMKPGEPAANLVQLQLEDFKSRIKGVDMKYAKSKNLTVYDVLTIASIIEHEAGVPSQRKLVAAVMYNRLHEGMSLGSDATVRYATGNFTKPLTESELESSSPYNTRNHVGLPPGPIGNPGLAAIEAAANPAKKDYLFFVTSPDCKTLAFAKTEAEFEKDVARYEASGCGE